MGRVQKPNCSQGRDSRTDMSYQSQKTKSAARIAQLGKYLYEFHPVHVDGKFDFFSKTLLTKPENSSDSRFFIPSRMILSRRIGSPQNTLRPSNKSRCLPS